MQGVGGALVKGLLLLVVVNAFHLCLIRPYLREYEEIYQNILQQKVLAIAYAPLTLCLAALVLWTPFALHAFITGTPTPRYSRFIAGWAAGIAIVGVFLSLGDFYLTKVAYERIEDLGVISHVVVAW